MSNPEHKDKKLRVALRDNLKKRKMQSRKLGDGEAFSVKLRSRDISKVQDNEKSPESDKE